MAQEVTNFARFYALFNKLPCTGDQEGLKKQIVLQYTRPGRIQEKHCAAVHVEPDGQSEGNDSQGV